MPIITSPALVITPPYDYEPHHPLVGWRNQVAFNNVVADSENASYPATNLANPSTYLKWVSGSTAEQLVTVSSLEGESDYIGIARHNFGSAAIEASVEAITAEPGAVWEEVLPAVQFADDTPAVLRFAKDFYIGTRLRLFPAATAPQCAVLFCGALIAIKPGIVPGYVPLPRAKSIDILNGRSERGEHLGSIITGAALRSAAQFRDIDPDFYDAELAEFVDGANHGDMYFWVWSPEEHPNEVALAWQASSVQPLVNRNTGEIDLSLDMSGLAL